MTPYDADGIQRRIFSQRLANGSVDNMAVDGSVTEQVFSVTPPTGEVWRIARWSLFVSDSGTFDTGNWGNGITLTNGLMPKLNGVDLLDFPITSTAVLASVGDAIEHYTFGTGNEMVVAKWDFKEAGQYIRLTDTDTLSLVVRDDLTGLDEQYTMISGYKE